MIREGARVKKKDKNGVVVVPRLTGSSISEWGDDETRTRDPLP